VSQKIDAKKYQGDLGNTRVEKELPGTGWGGSPEALRFGGGVWKSGGISGGGSYSGQLSHCRTPAPASQKKRARKRNTNWKRETEKTRQGGGKDARVFTTRIHFASRQPRCCTHSCGGGGVPEKGGGGGGQHKAREDYSEKTMLRLSRKKWLQVKIREKTILRWVWKGEEALTALAWQAPISKERFHEKNWI